jgi:hypothetical protein
VRSRPDAAAVGAPGSRCNLVEERFLQQPLTEGDLTDKLREVLDA